MSCLARDEGEEGRRTLEADEVDHQLAELQAAAAVALDLERALDGRARARARREDDRGGGEADGRAHERVRADHVHVVDVLHRRRRRGGEGGEVGTGGVQGMVMRDQDGRAPTCQAARSAGSKAVVRREAAARGAACAERRPRAGSPSGERSGRRLTRGVRARVRVPSRRERSVESLDALLPCTRASWSARHVQLGSCWREPDGSRASSSTGGSKAERRQARCLLDRPAVKGRAIERFGGGSLRRTGPRLRRRAHLGSLPSLPLRSYRLAAISTAPFLPSHPYPRTLSSPLTPLSQAPWSSLSPRTRPSRPCSSPSTAAPSRSSSCSTSLVRLSSPLSLMETPSPAVADRPAVLASPCSKASSPLSPAARAASA